MANTSDGKPNPGQRILELMMGSWASQAVGTLARLRVFDAVARGTTSADAIAAELGLAPDALFRVMRAGTMLGVLERRGERAFALTPSGELLRSDVPGSMRALIDAETAPGHWLPWAKLDGCVRAGRSLARETLGKDVWSYYAEHAEEGRAFSEGMSGLSAMALGAIGAVWQPPPATRVVDVGGAHGAFLRWVLERLPAARGVLFDLPHVVASAQNAGGATALGARVECVAGDFSREVPAGGDLYLLKHILHDWDDAGASAILRQVRKAMTKDATVVVVEMLVPEDGTPSPALLLDLNMLVMLPGRERTAAEMRALFAKAGLELTRTTPTPSPFVVLEARAG